MSPLQIYGAVLRAYFTRNPNPDHVYLLNLRQMVYIGTVGGSGL